MDLYTALALLLVIAAAFAYVNLRFLKMPTAIGLMVLGLVASLALVGLAQFEVKPVLEFARLVNRLDFSTIVMQVMLGFLLFAGAIHVDTRSLGRLRWPVSVLALVGTPLSTALVAGAMYLLLPWFGLPTPFIYCLLFGALISPTDPVAVLSILTKANIPKSLETKIVGESLFNDGVGVVLFVVTLEVALLGPGDVTLSHALAIFLRETVGGLALGTALGLGAGWLLRTIDNYQVEVLITLALVAGGTALATYLHTSGPLAMVMAGLLVGHFSRSGGMLSDASQDYVDKFWELIDEVLNALLFVLMGLEVLVLHIPGRTVLAGLAAIAVVLAARLAAVALPLGLLRVRNTFRASDHSLAVLTWGGLRGGLSVALALSLPATMPRELLVGITYVVVVFSIIGQGLTIGPLVRWLGVAQPNTDAAKKHG
ncbi:sodium:proton antiporter [Microvirga sp. STS02]|uniref:cation:proton antiporter n=1 Tax=Hymenobacter negativus TaxID=2795026 RepID=UPI0018DBABA7|nr:MULTISPECIES: sodium:proton antiporter [Bacteria]MBH8571028.1 sodium:proton antiporter [Hymenobacter negativus]MBR7210765.1 sodium:proton antiporter [Microvirga sp. STS02]